MKLQKSTFLGAIDIMGKKARNRSKLCQKTRKKFQGIQKNSNSTRFIFQNSNGLELGKSGLEPIPNRNAILESRSSNKLS